LFVVLFAASTSLSGQTYKVVYTFGTQLNDGYVDELISQSRGGALVTKSESQAFRIWPNGSAELLFNFHYHPIGWASGLALAVDGRFYGTTPIGGPMNIGTVFTIMQDGTKTVIHNFVPSDNGAYPESSPIQSVEGDFYGTTTYTNTADTTGGSVYRMTKKGKLTLLHNFTGTEGDNPIGPLVQGTDYYFYGTALSGGQYGYGTIYRISSTGDFKVLVSFNQSNGDGPLNGLIQASDGNFYGVTEWGGSSGRGVLFRMTPAGVLTVLHNFTGGSDGGTPRGGLVQASDGNLYGTTFYGGSGGSNQFGVLFRSTLAGDLVTLHDFVWETGNQPSTLMQHTNGGLYGFAAGGSSGAGVLYSLDAGLPPFVTYLPTYGRAGALVQILGQGFTTNSKVSFNGTPATSPVIVYPTYLRVEVPPGATTGPITVTTSNGTLTSNKVFIVHLN
jgi:uncharacterized repeat protein (TIGR03803 family)